MRSMWTRRGITESQGHKVREAGKEEVIGEGSQGVKRNKGDGKGREGKEEGSRGGEEGGCKRGKGKRERRKGSWGHQRLLNINAGNQEAAD
ncbi:hypothetical protein Sjap_010862 [Stephania japonica]|uniref:Uncharacterized protein n=1 Tax=Stephania japonica TaxID=461633 RepID=A0AAP0P6V9_9MAGN